MNKQELKQKLDTAKKKIKKYTPHIIAGTATVAAYGLALMLIEEKKKAIVQLKESCDYIQKDFDRMQSPFVNLPDEDREKLKGGSSLIFDYPNGDQFCLMHHTDDCTIED